MRFRTYTIIKNKIIIHLVKIERRTHAGARDCHGVISAKKKETKLISVTWTQKCSLTHRNSQLIVCSAFLYLEETELRGLIVRLSLTVIYFPIFRHAQPDFFRECVLTSFMNRRYIRTLHSASIVLCLLLLALRFQKFCLTQYSYLEILSNKKESGLAG